MALAITSWNIDPNREWYVRLMDDGSYVAVELYLTEADADAQTNRQAYGYTTGYGTDLPVVLTNEIDATIAVSLFQQSISWHLLVAGQNADSDKVFRVKEFLDLPEIEHPLFRNGDLISVRATAEIDAHTHARITKQIELGSHIPTLEPGQIVLLDSDRRAKTEYLQVMAHQITFDQSTGDARLTSSIEAAAHIALSR